VPNVVENLLGILDLEPLEHNLFRGVSPGTAGSASSAGRWSARR
jgi:acyl-CoA thioesterase